MNITKLVRSNILAMKAYSSARDEFKSTSEVTLLDANENPYPTDWNRYPDPYQSELKKVVAELKGISSNQIFLGNGSDEAIDLIFRVFCNPGKDNIIIPEPTYGMYEVAAAIQNIEVKKVPLTKEFELVSSDILSAVNTNTKLVFLCNPNNPTGNLLNTNEIRKVLNTFEGIVVIDEAYIDFTKDESSINLLADFPNLIVLQTFSKAWGLAGLRIGAAYASTGIINLLNKVKPPYNLNILTQKTTSEIIKNGKDNFEKTVQVLLKEREILSERLSELENVLIVFPSDANFLLVKFTNHKTVFETLTKAGLIVRDRSKALNCENCLRITIGTEKENELLIETLKMI